MKYDIVCMMSLLSGIGDSTMVVRFYLGRLPNHRLGYEVASVESVLH